MVCVDLNAYLFPHSQAIQKGAMGSNQYVDLEATNYDGE